MTLAELQSEFANHLLYKETDISKLNISGPFSANELMTLYRNNFYISVTDYLKACFPTVQALVGEEFFEQLAKSFIINVPIETASIELYGELFSGFIETCQQTESVPYLSGVASIDWAYDRAKTHFEFTQFPFEQLASLASEEQLKISFKLQKMTTVITSEYPILDIWQGVKTGSLDGIDLDQSSFTVIYPSLEEGAKCLSITEVQYRFLKDIENNKKLEELAELDSFQQQLSLFIENTIINNFTLEGES